MNLLLTVLMKIRVFKVQLIIKTLVFCVDDQQSNTPNLCNFQSRILFYWPSLHCTPPLLLWCPSVLLYIAIFYIDPIKLCVYEIETHIYGTRVVFDFELDNIYIGQFFFIIIIRNLLVML